jgi:GNAT superfamily N-acetyltransferase
MRGLVEERPTPRLLQIKSTSLGFCSSTLTCFNPQERILLPMMEPLVMQKISDEQGRGFIIFDAIDDCTFVFELLVTPEFQRKGVGTRLVQRAIEATGKPRVWGGKVSADGMAFIRKLDPTARFRRLTPTERVENEPHVTHVHLKPS